MKTLLLAILLLNSQHVRAHGDDLDADGWIDSVDCEPLNPHVYPGANENCPTGCLKTQDGIDNDCDQEIDEADECIDEFGINALLILPFLVAYKRRQYTL